MGAADIVGVDFQLRLGVGFGVGAEHKVPVELIGIGELGFGFDEDFSVEDGAGVIGKDALVKLTADAVGVVVMDEGVIVGVLVFSDGIKAIEASEDIGSVKSDREVVSCDSGAEVEAKGFESGGDGLADAGVVDVEGLEAVELGLDVCQVCIFGEEDICKGVVEVAEVGRCADEGFENRCRSCGADGDDVSGECHDVRLLTGEDVKQVNGLLAGGVIVEVDIGAVTEEGGIETGEGVFGVFVFAPLFSIVPIIGTIFGALLGALLGTFAGAMVGELSAQETTMKDSVKPAFGATVGRVVGTAGKLGITIAMWLVLSLFAFWP